MIDLDLHYVARLQQPRVLASRPTVDRTRSAAESASTGSRRRLRRRARPAKPAPPTHPSTSGPVGAGVSGYPATHPPRGATA